MPDSPLKVFIICARADEEFRKDLMLQLKVLVDQNLIEIWDDSHILPGEDWEKRSLTELEKSELVIMLVSANSIIFDSIQSKELKRTLERKVRFVPVLVRECLWDHVPQLAPLKMLPRHHNGTTIPVSDWHDTHNAWTSVGRELMKLVNDKRADDHRTLKQEQPKSPFKSTIQESTPHNKVISFAKRYFFEPEMVFVEGERFKMGNLKYPPQKPVHDVTIPSFWIGKYPVTFDEFDRFCTDTGHKRPKDNGWGRKRRPVININFQDAEAYCKWLSEKTKKTYRLPSEAEWEFAARGGKKSKSFLYSGGNKLHEVGWFWENSGKTRLFGHWNSNNLFTNRCRTHSVGQKRPNELQIFDMSGNVWEWCGDYWHDNYEGAPVDGSAWLSKPKNIFERVLRGGSWINKEYSCKVWDRTSGNAAIGSNGCGFRVAQNA